MSTSTGSKRVAVVIPFRESRDTFNELTHLLMVHAHEAGAHPFLLNNSDLVIDPPVGSVVYVPNLNNAYEVRNHAINLLMFDFDAIIFIDADMFCSVAWFKEMVDILQDDDTTCVTSLCVYRTGNAHLDAFLWENKMHHVGLTSGVAYPMSVFKNGARFDSAHPSGADYRFYVRYRGAQSRLCLTLQVHHIAYSFRALSKKYIRYGYGPFLMGMCSPLAIVRYLLDSLWKLATFPHARSSTWVTSSLLGVWFESCRLMGFVLRVAHVKGIR